MPDGSHVITMHTLPPKPTLVQYATTALRDLIIRGYWSDQLPSERVLSQRLDISRPTLRAALKTLENEQLIIRKWGAPWRISANAVDASKADDKKIDVPVIFLNPLRLEQMDMVMLYRFERLTENLAAHGFRLELISERAVSDRDPPAAILERLDRLRPAAWILQHCSTTIQRWFSDRSAPALIIGTPAPDIKLISVDIDFQATAFHAVGRLRSLGHAPEDIVVFFPQDILPGNQAALDGIQAGLKVAPDAMNIVRIAKGISTVAEDLDRIMRRPAPPTALIFMWPMHALTAMTHLGIQRGLRIPSEMSLMTLDDNPVLRFVTPAISRYRRDNEVFTTKIIHELNRVIQGTVRLYSTVKMLSEFVPGETLAPPRTANLTLRT